MSTAVERLMSMVTAEDRFNHSHEELRQLQLEALNERFQDRKDRIKLLAHRASEASITEIRSFEDVVPLLFPHTAYKSYPESFLAEGKWDRMNKWLGTVSAYPIADIDLDGVTGIDDWLDRLEAKGHFVSCSSGTTGKPAMLIASEVDIKHGGADSVRMFSWSSGVQPTQDRRVMGLAPIAKIPLTLEIGRALDDGFGDPAKEHYRLNVPQITIGELTKMIGLRKRIGEGTAAPEEIAGLEQGAKAKEAMLKNAMVEAAQALINNREEKLLVAGMWSALYGIAKIVREMGYGKNDFHPDNCIYVAGGLKGAQLPDDYQEFVHETFNIPAGREFQVYSMQELNTTMPKCGAGRYHVPPWVVPLLLDESGEKLLPPVDGEQEGRAAFFDLGLDGRWGGVISGDKISLDFRLCACGHASPSIRNNVTRYTDLKGDDKIACSGTVDAYVRGVS